MDKEPTHSARANFAENDDVNRVEVYLEFHGFGTRKAESLQNRKFIVDVLPFGDRQGLNITTSSAFVTENMVELPFDITALYNTAIKKHRVALDFTFKILRTNGKIAKSLMKDNAKAFILVYQRVESCSFPDFVNREKRFRRSTKVNPENSDAKTCLKPFTASDDFGLCKVTTFPVNFTEVGLDFIIHPEVQDIGLCRGICPIQNVESGYGLMQIASYQSTKRGQPSSCYPTEFGSMTVIYVDYSDEMPVIAKFSEMIVKNCTCI